MIGGVYDKAKWHYDGNFPEELPPFQGYIHTGMYLGWLADHDLLTPEYMALAEEFKQRKQTGPQFYEKIGGVLAADMLTEEGNTFTQLYYDSQTPVNDYFADYFDLFMSLEDIESVYHVQDTWENYAHVAEMIDERYAEQKHRR